MANHSANSAFPSWENLEAALGVTLPRDPLNQQGSLASQPLKSFNYNYDSRLPSNSPLYCPEGQYYMLIYRLEKGDATGAERGGLKRCSDGSIWYGGHGAIITGVSPAA